jgi:isopentenyl diphosphate isomerase/L-lactate dehydrogenase-like FMN-dependent dehydrogenase
LGIRLLRLTFISGRTPRHAVGALAPLQAGVATAIEILRKELAVTMALTGVRSIKEIDRRVLVS